MKTWRSNRALSQGNVLMVTLFIITLLGILLVSCLSLVHWQNVSVARSQAWNACIPVIEAGIEEAMAHLNNAVDTNLTADGWVLKNDLCVQQRKIGDDVYVVTINLTNPLAPVLVCTGYVRVGMSGPSAPDPGSTADWKGHYIARAVRVTARKTPQYVKAMVAKEQIDMNGNNINTDSFDSSDPNYSTPDGRYDPNKIKDNGDVSTLSGLTDSLDIGNANIKGRLRTGPGGTARLGPNGKVGSLLWHATARSGMQPGWISHDMNMSFPPVARPFNVGAIPASGTINGVDYAYVLGSGNYQMPSVSLSSSDKIAVTGNAVLLVDGDVSISGSAGIDIMPPGSLKLYVAGGSASIAGAGINHTGCATNFIYYGLPSNKGLMLQSNGEFTGSIYAPDTDLRMVGGGSGVQNFVGACIMKNITVNGHYNFHYDEALGKFGPPAIYVIISWVEI